MIPRRLPLKWECVIWEEGAGPCLLLSLWSCTSLHHGNTPWRKQRAQPFLALKYKTKQQPRGWGGRDAQLIRAIGDKKGFAQADARDSQVPSRQQRWCVVGRVR